MDAETSGEGAETRYRIDFTIMRRVGDGDFEEYAWGGGASSLTVRQAAYEVMSMLENEQWVLTQGGAS